MNTTSPWLANLWHHFASAEAPHAVKLHASRQVAFETLSLRVVWFPRAKMKHSAFPHCQTRIVTKNIHLFGIFLILSPRKNGCFTWKGWNTFQMRRKSTSHMGFDMKKSTIPFKTSGYISAENTCHLTQMVEFSTIHHNTSANTVAMRLCNS